MWRNFRDGGGFLAEAGLVYSSNDTAQRGSIVAAGAKLSRTCAFNAVLFLLTFFIFFMYEAFMKLSLDASRNGDVTGKENKELHSRSFSLLGRLRQMETSQL